MESTSATPETAVSPTAATITTSAMPTKTARSCSTKSGPNRRIISFRENIPILLSSVSLCFNNFYELLFTRCANSNGFCRCFAFQIGKICCHHDIIRHFQFRKCLPVYSNFYDTYFAVNLQVLLFTETNLGYTRECSLALQRAAKRHHLIKESLI